MFGFRKTETPPVQLYGKLPLAKDYMRIGLSEDGGVALRDWLDASYSGAVRDRSGQLAGPMRFLAGDAWDTCMHGVIEPSSDAGGHRLFPFTMCVERKRKAVLEDLQNGMTQAGSVWHALAEMRQRADGHTDGRSLLAAHRSVELDFEKLRPVDQAGVDADAWLDGVWPERGREGFAADLDQLMTLDPNGREPIRLPLMSGCSQRQQVSAWLELLGRIGLIEERTCPTFFMPAEFVPVTSFGLDGDYKSIDENEQTATATPALTLFRAPPNPSHSRWLAAADPNESLGESDFVGGRAPLKSFTGQTREDPAPLTASVRSTVSACLSRAGRRD